MCDIQQESNQIIYRVEDIILCSVRYALTKVHDISSAELLDEATPFADDGHHNELPFLVFVLALSTSKGENFLVCCTAYMKGYGKPVRMLTEKPKKLTVGAFLLVLFRLNWSGRRRLGPLGIQVLGVLDQVCELKMD